ARFRVLRTTDSSTAPVSWDLPWEPCKSLQVPRHAHRVYPQDSPESLRVANRARARIDKRQPFPVVGVGASAGGLEAFSQLLQNLPPDTGMAFVLVQHLAPKHESILPSLLSRATPMPVRQAEEGLPIEPDHVYVIPPGQDMLIHDSQL